MKFLMVPTKVLIGSTSIHTSDHRMKRNLVGVSYTVYAVIFEGRKIRGFRC